MTETLTAKTAFAELEPGLDRVAELVSLSPLDPADRLGLALMVAGKMLGLACAHLKLANPALKDAELPSVMTALIELLGEEAARREAQAKAEPAGPAT